MMEQKRAWVYCRIDAPEDTNGGLKNQKKDLYDYAEQMGFSVCGSSQDIGNGLNMNESGLMEVKQAAEQEKIDVLVIKTLNRLGRNKDMVSELLSILENRNIALYSPLEGHITLDTYKE